MTDKDRIAELEAQQKAGLLVLTNWPDEFELGWVPNTDDADPVSVLWAVRDCARAWKPEVRLIGNVRAGDIVRALNAVLQPMPHKGKAD